MAEAGKLALTGTNAIEFGSTYVMPMRVQKPNGDRENLTDFSLGEGGLMRAHFRYPDVDSATVVFTLALVASATEATPGIEIEGDPTQGDIKLVISSTDTIAAQAADQNGGVWDLEGEAADGTIKRWIGATGQEVFSTWEGFDNVTRE